MIVVVHSARDRPLITSVSDNNHEGGEVIMRMPYQNELYHHGIPGMKWGIRRYQNPDGTLTAAGRRRYGTVENLERGMTKTQADAHEAEKKAAINSGKASEVQKFSSELTREEMAYAVQRIRDEQTLSDLRAKDVAAGQQKVKAIIDAGGQLKTAGETVKSVYNLVAQANNAFNKNKLPIIGNPENDKKSGDKKLSVEDQTKLFKLEQDKKKAAREEEIDNLIKEKGVDYFKENSQKFTTEELQRVLAYKKASESDQWGRSESSSNDNAGGPKKNQNQDGSKQTQDKNQNQSGSQKKNELRDLPGGVDFVKDKKNSGEPDTSFESPAVSTAKTSADLSTKASKFVKDVANSGAPVTSAPTKSGSDWVKDNWDNETPFGRFKTVSLSEAGASVDFKGVVFTKETDSSRALRDTYDNYMDQHPNSEASFDDFVRWQNKK